MNYIHHKCNDKAPVTETRPLHSLVTFLLVKLTNGNRNTVFLIVMILDQQLNAYNIMNTVLFIKYIVCEINTTF